MSLVTFFAFGGDHIRAVWFMALRTEWNFTMNIMTEAAGQIAMLALNLLQLDDLTGMACQTLIGDIICQLDNFGSMRVIVTAQTSGQIIVRLAGMALTTGRYNLFY
jgi:TolB-like protein